MREAGAVATFEAFLRLGDFTLDAAFDCHPGITALFGPSGSGKTTILNLIAGVLAPERGRIVLGERTLVDTSRGIFVRPHRRRVGLVYQDAQLFPHLTVGQNIRFGSWFTRGAAREIAPETVIRVLGISGLLDRRPARLSGGERQRVALARALLSAPALLLMDEPLAGLDDARRLEIMPLVETMRDEFAIPIVYVTHAVSEVMRLADRVVRLENGRVIGIGTPADLKPPAA